MKYIGETLIEIAKYGEFEFVCWVILIFMIVIILIGVYFFGRIHSFDDQLKLQKFNELEEENEILKEAIKIKKEKK